MLNGYQKVYKFDNGYGASVIWSELSYGGNQGLFEVAILDENENLLKNGPFDDYIFGFLDFEGVAKKLNEIKNLPNRLEGK